MQARGGGATAPRREQWTARLWDGRTDSQRGRQFAGQPGQRVAGSAGGDPEKQAGLWESRELCHGCVEVDKPPSRMGGARGQPESGAPSVPLAKLVRATAVP